MGAMPRFLLLRVQRKEGESVSLLAGLRREVLLLPELGRGSDF